MPTNLILTLTTTLGKLDYISVRPGFNRFRPDLDDEDVSASSIFLPAMLGVTCTLALVGLAYLTRDKTCADLIEKMQEDPPELYEQTIGLLQRSLQKVSLAPKKGSVKYKLNISFLVSHA